MTTAAPPIQVLIVEDFAVARLLLQELLSSHPRLHVFAAVDSGEAALTVLERSRPDVIVMDIHLPGIDGYETTRRIMETQPVPIILCTAHADAASVANMFHAIEAGALAVVLKPAGAGHPEHDTSVARLLESVLLMSEIRVVKRWPRLRRPTTPSTPAPSSSRSPVCPYQVVAIGASTGGPPVLQTILSGLPADLPVPVLIVQHIAPGFLTGLTDWLNQTSGFPVSIAEHDQPAQPGRAYFAPDGYHLGLSATGRIALSRLPPENSLRPAVSYLFRSVATVYGARAIAVLLTGMGHDGAEELKILHDLGALTVAQDAESSVVHGMPGVAIRLGGASQVLAPEKIATALTQWLTPTALRRLT